jgi:hypothetical protein
MSAYTDIKPIGRNPIRSFDDPPRRASKEMTAGDKRQRRAELRATMVEQDRQRRRYRDALASLAAFNARVDQRADEHVAACAPIQAELQTIEARAECAESERRRLELVAELTRLNAQLDADLDRLESERRQLDRQRVEAAKGLPVGGLNEITNADLLKLAEPQLIGRYELAKHAATFWQQRLSLLDDLADATDAELNDCREQLARATAERDEAYENCLRD